MNSLMKTSIIMLVIGGVIFIVSLFVFFSDRFKNEIRVASIAGILGGLLMLITAYRFYSTEKIFEESDAAWKKYLDSLPKQ